MKIIRLILIGVVLLSRPVCAADDKQFVISYVEHESMTSYYLPLLEQAYRSIGIIPKFVLINDKRALKLLNKGLIDADTAKTTEMLAKYPNIIPLPTPISSIEVVLICQVGLKCDLSGLKDSDKTLGIIGAKEFYANQLTEARVTIAEVTSFDVLLKLFKQEKVDFIISVFDQFSEKSKLQFPNRYLIEEKKGFHLLHKKHQVLIPKLEQALRALDSVTPLKG